MFTVVYIGTYNCEICYVVYYITCLYLDLTYVVVNGHFAHFAKSGGIVT